MTRLGFIGTGSITAAMVRGLKASPLQAWPVLLTPRNAGLAAELASSLPGVTVAADNQAVVDGADMVFLAIRPQIAESVLRPLHFRAGQNVVSLIAGVSCQTIADWTGATQVTRAIPLPFVQACSDVTPIHPPRADVAQVFDALGKALPVSDATAFDVYSSASALMATYFSLVETASDWMVAQGLEGADARRYLGALFGNLGDVLRGDLRSLEALRVAHSTAGGLNEQVFHQFTAAGGATALTDALTSVYHRVAGLKP
jgi:pyrroline-5-carboxylate reductase